MLNSCISGAVVGVAEVKGLMLLHWLAAAGTRLADGIGEELLA
jgi:hypothetical protein